MHFIKKTTSHAGEMLTFKHSASFILYYSNINEILQFCFIAICFVTNFLFFSIAPESMTESKPGKLIFLHRLELCHLLINFGT